MVRRALDGRHPELVEPIVPRRAAPSCRRSATAPSTDVARVPAPPARSTAVVLTGQVTEQCILYTALDAYVRHFAVCVPSDAVAPIDPALGDAALEMMERNMRAEIVAADEVLQGMPART